MKRETIEKDRIGLTHAAPAHASSPRDAAPAPPAPLCCHGGQWAPTVRRTVDATDAGAASDGAGGWPWWAADVASGRHWKRPEGEHGRGARHGDKAGCGGRGCNRELWHDWM
uniref:Uncharacterized protein n=1 Tax=Oryza meridionalis TaxID=40149 RepID=A0A0E0C4Z5_9ORYZ